MPRVLQNPVKLSFPGLLARFQLQDRAEADSFCAFSVLQWSGTKSNKDSGTEVPAAIWLHSYTSLPLLPWVGHSLCSRPCTWPQVDLWRREDLNPCWAVPSWYDFQPHSYGKTPDNETCPSALPRVPGITSSIPRAAHSLCPTAHVQQARDRLVFSLTLSNWTISGSFTGCAWSGKPEVCCGVPACSWGLEQNYL